jgi:hypothetical protein
MISSGPPTLLVHLEHDELFRLAPGGLEATLLLLRGASAFLLARRGPQFAAAAIDLHAEAFAAAVSCGQLARAVQGQFATTIGQGRLARMHADAMHFLLRQLDAAFRQLGTRRCVRRQQRGQAAHVTHQRRTLPFGDAQHAQFRIQPAAFRTTPPPGTPPWTAVQRRHPQQQPAQQAYP